MLYKFLFSSLLLFSMIHGKIIAEIQEQVSLPLKQEISNEVWEDIYESLNNSRNWPGLHYALFNNHFEAAEWFFQHQSDTIPLKTPDIKVKRWIVELGD